VHIHTSSFRQILPRRVNPCPPKNKTHRKGYSKKLPFTSHLLPKTLKLKGVKYTISHQTSLQPRERTAERYCSIRVVVLGPESFRGLTISELRVSNFPNFLIFAYCRMTPFIPCFSERVKVVPIASGVVQRRLIGELGTPKVAQIFAYAWKCLCIYGASDLHQRRLQTHHCAQRSAFWGVNDIPLNFGIQTLKNRNFGPINNFNTYADNDEIFTWDSNYKWDFMGGPTTSLNKFIMADGGHIKLRKMLIPSSLYEDICTQFRTKCNTAQTTDKHCITAFSIYYIQRSQECSDDFKFK